ncbi:hypothetical protein IQ07DRAFT_112056 [Pyrenochaeta sp. DS3sAY3a]|nr:hypothetical protein IQ07DRAFT_112056 [Pyrenochaeta sp. DS3sAY3a]
MSSPQNTPEVQRALLALSTIIRETTLFGARPIPPNPTRFNLLARPAPSVCGFCSLPGHYSGHSPATLTSALPCRAAFTSLFDFWTDVLAHLRVLHAGSPRFRVAVDNFAPVWALGEEGERAAPLPGGDVEVVLLDALARAWVKFGKFLGRVRARIFALVPIEECEVFEDEVRGGLNELLLNGLCLKDLFERSVAGERGE